MQATLETGDSGSFPVPVGFLILATKNMEKREIQMVLVKIFGGIYRCVFTVQELPFSVGICIHLLHFSIGFMPAKPV